MRISVRVRPSAGRTAAGGAYNDALIVRVVQATVDGKATAAVARCLAEAFGVRAADVVLISGSRSRNKVFEVSGATETALQELMDA